MKLLIIVFSSLIGYISFIFWAAIFRHIRTNAEGEKSVSKYYYYKASVGYFGASLILSVIASPTLMATSKSSSDDLVASCVLAIVLNVAELIISINAYNNKRASEASKWQSIANGADAYSSDYKSTPSHEAQKPAAPEPPIGVMAVPKMTATPKPKPEPKPIPITVSTPKPKPTPRPTPKPKPAPKPVSKPKPAPELKTNTGLPYKIINVKQGSEAWLKLREGRVTGTTAHSLRDYSVNYVVSLNDRSRNSGYKSDSMIRGHELEPIGIARFAREYNKTVKTVGFCDSTIYEHAGFSPDGVILDENGAIKTIVEHKAFNPRRHFANYNQIENNIMYQIQYGMFVTGARDAYLVLFNPDIDQKEDQLLVQYIHRDKEIQDIFRDRFKNYRK